MPAQSERHAALTVGTFDGVHLGHRRLIEATRQAAQRDGLRAVAVTFDRHPLATVRPEATPQLITGLEHKVELLYSTGVDEVVVLEFDEARAGQSAEDFVRRFLVEELSARIVVIGEGFRFGHRQSGDAALLEAMGGELGFSLEVVPLVGKGAPQGAVSSSRIRQLISEGALEEAASLLGRHHEVRGDLAAVEQPVVLVPQELVVPPPAGYLVSFSAGGVTRPAFASLAPAAGATALSLRFDSDGVPPDIQPGEHAAVEFLSGADPFPADGEAIGVRQPAN